MAIQRVGRVMAVMPGVYMGLLEASESEANKWHRESSLCSPAHRSRGRQRDEGRIDKLGCYWAGVYDWVRRSHYHVCRRCARDSGPSSTPFDQIDCKIHSVPPAINSRQSAKMTGHGSHLRPSAVPIPYSKTVSRLTKFLQC